MLVTEEERRGKEEGEGVKDEVKKESTGDIQQTGISTKSACIEVGWSLSFKYNFFFLFSFVSS